MTPIERHLNFASCPIRRPLVCPVLVGRDDLLDLADRRIAEVTADGGRFLLLAGEAGVGKTRLLGAMERRAAASGFRTVRGGAYPSDLQVPGAILIDLARAMQRQPGLAPLGTRLAERLEDRPGPRSQDAADEPDGAGPTVADPKRRRRLLVLDVAELLAETAADTPTVVALEDLHWTDDLTLEVLEALARRVPDTRLLLIGTYRSDELFPRAPMREWRSRLLGSRQAEEVRLGRLSAADTATMTTLLAGTGLPAAQRHRRGDPRTERTASRSTSRSSWACCAASPGAGAEAVRAAEVPETVEDAVLARLEHRSADAASVAQAGAVIGRSFDLDLLASVTGRDPDELSAPASPSWPTTSSSCPRASRAATASATA